MAKKAEIKQVQGTLVKLMAYMQKRRTASDPGDYRTTGRFDVLVQSLRVEAGFYPKSEIPLERAKEITEGTYAFEWDDAFERRLLTALSAYGIGFSDVDYKKKDYSTPTREELLKASRNRKPVKVIAGKHW